MVSPSGRRISPLLHPQAFWASLPRPVPEESIALRFLTQSLVIVGILATTIAATDVADPIRSSFWAIPLSIVGAIWSYSQRRKRNITAKILIAMGMLVALFFFLGALVNQSNDTRLILAELLIQLQALHCFDLPRRKDLGYSLVIGLILMGVAATISQTLIFAPFLVLFLAIALPVLVLDYRSRLGLGTMAPDPEAGPGSSPRSSLNPMVVLSPRRLGLLLAAVVILGLVIFAFLPRLPSYQLQTFPVSAPIDVPGQFDNQVISNPGYVSQGAQEENPEDTGDGDPRNVSGGGQSPTEGPGTLDDTFYYGFNTKINQNLRGSSLTPKLVMRVRSQAEGFWRVMAFDHYTGQGWEVSRNEATQTLDRPFYSYKFFLPKPDTIARHREVVQTFTIVSDLPNLIPALYQADDLYFPTRQVAVDTEGALRSPVPLSEGTTYTVISEVPYRDRSLLREAPTTYPGAIRRHYLQVPEDSAPAIRQRTEELLAKSPNPLTQPYEQALYLAQTLKQQYRLQPDLPFLETSEDLAQSFLFTYQGGYPDHFATTLTIMLRSIGIPARLVVGFAPGEFNPFTGLYLVKNTDAYAMTEVFFPGYGWFAFDPIPGHEVIPPALEESYTFSTIKRLWLWVAGWLPTPLKGILDQVLLLIGGLLGVILTLLGRLLSGNVQSALTLALVLAAMGLLGWWGWLLLQGWRYQRWLNRLPPMERYYQRLLHCLGQQGWPKHPAQTPREYGDRLQDHLPPELWPTAQQILSAYSQWHYGQVPINGTEIQRQISALERHYQHQSWLRNRAGSQS